MTAGIKDKKLKANEFGHFAEELASQEYIKRGYAILEKNWRLGKTEIDIIAQKDNVIVLIEVKARKSSEEDALDAVNIDKRKRMIRAADSYLNKLEGWLEYRFDIVTCTGTMKEYKMEIFENAFIATDIF